MRHCKRCSRELYEGEGLRDGICGDCGLEQMFTQMPNTFCVKKKAGEPLMAKHIEQALKEEQSDGDE